MGADGAHTCYRIDVADKHYFVVLLGEDLLKVDTWVGLEAREHLSVHTSNA